MVKMNSKLSCLVVCSLLLGLWIQVESVGKGGFKIFGFMHHHDDEHADLIKEHKDMFPKGADWLMPYQLKDAIAATRNIPDVATKCVNLANTVAPIVGWTFAAENKRKDMTILFRKVALYIRSDEAMQASPNKGLFFAFVESCIDELSGRLLASIPSADQFDTIAASQFEQILHEATGNDDSSQLDKCHKFVDKIKELIPFEEQGEQTEVRQQMSELVLINYIQNGLAKSGNNGELKGVVEFVDSCESLMEVDIFKKRADKMFYGHGPQQYEPQILEELGLEFLESNH